MAPQDLAAFGFTTAPVNEEEIDLQTQGKWAALFDALVNAKPGGLFVAPFTRKDSQNFANSARKRAAKAGLQLRWSQATRNEVEGFYLWLTPVASAPAEEV